MELYKQISDANRIKYGTEAEKILRIIINQYSDRTHFIYEILQNAEDAGATRIQFHLEKEKLVIKHDGRPFNEKDIEGVCGIANGTKEDGTRIGHFGIGFKSVYCYTEHPYIYSGEYHFVIQNQLFPKEVPGSQEIAYDETCMILPFDKGEVPSSIAYQEIRDALTKKITAESIIMLNQISDVRIKIDGYPEEIEINKAKYSLDKKAYADNVFGLSMNTTITNTRSKQTRTKDADYLFFTDANAEATAIIFRVEGKELKAIKNSKIYAFFPTAKEAHQNFYIHAPFDTTPARDNFKEGAEYGKHNIKLIKAVGELIWFAFQWMKNHQYLSVSGFNTVFPVYEYEADDVLYGIYQNSIDMIREEALLPTNVPGEFKKIQEICVPLWGIIVDTFDDNDLRALRRKRNISWLAKEFSTEAYRDVRAFLNQNFKLETLEWKDLVLNMNAFFLSQKQLSWMEALMSKIESYCIKRATYDSHYIDVSQIPFVRTVSQEQICARDEHGKLQVYLNNPDIAKYRIESTFIKNECIRSFYRRALEIPEYNIEQETIENILPKYESANVKFKTKDPITENIDDLKVIKDAIYTNTSILERIKDKYIVTDGKNWYRPEEMYLRSNDTRSGYALVKGIIRIKYLADTYFDGTLRSLKLDEDFFKKIGCNAGIRMMPASRDEYLRAIRKYCGAKAESDYRTNIFFKTYISKKLDWSFNYEGFPDIFTDMTKEKSLSIARFLNPNAMNFDIQGELVAADDQHFSGKNVESMMAYSMLGLQLCYEKWIYIQGDPFPHTPLEIDKEDLLPEYKTAKRLMAILPFKKEVKSALTEWLDANIDDKSDLNLIKHYLSDPEALAKVAKAMAKNEAQMEAKKNKVKSAKELIEQGDRKQRESEKDDMELEISPISEKGKLKREKNLDRQLADSMDNFISVARGLSFSSRPSNKEERIFLEQEYDGHCQICLKQIRKYNGEHYFEAINIIKFSKLPEKLANSGKYGWNSLCLCPNCAAEYNYCSANSDLGYELINYQTIKIHKDGKEYGIKLSRQFDIDQASLYGYVNLRTDEDVIFQSGITDPFLVRVLNIRKKQHNLTDIFVTIQENQNKIVNTDFNKNIIVQGCAGSGKTMVLLHRLSALKYRQRYFDFSQNALILTPNEQFSLHIKGLAEGLQIGSVHRISVEQYYLDMLLQYDSAFKPENKIVSEMQVRQDYVDYIYSDQFKNDFERAYNDILEKRNGLVDILIQLQEAMNQEKKTISWTEESRFTIQMKYSVDALNDLLRKKEQDFASAQDKITKAEERRAFLEDRIPASEQFAKSIVQESLPRVNTKIGEYVLEKQQEIEALNKKIQELQEEYARIQGALIIFGKRAKLEKLDADIEEVKAKVIPLQTQLDEQKKILSMRQDGKEDDEILAWMKQVSVYIKKVQDEVRLCSNAKEEYSRFFNELSESDDNIKAAYEGDHRVEAEQYSEEIKKTIQYLYEQLEKYSLVNIYQQIYDESVQVFKEKNGVKSITGKCHRYDLYVQLMFAMKYFNKKIGNMQFICVDEGQDLAVNEYRLLSELNQNHVVFNIFGDTNQLMKSGRGISDWNLLLSELQAEQYVLNENYRNTNQISG